MNKNALIKEIKRINQDIDRKARNVEALASKGPSFALQAAGVKRELEVLCGYYFTLIGEYTGKGIISDMSIGDYIIPDISSKSDVVIDIWSDVISRSKGTNTEEYKGLAAGSESDVVVFNSDEEDVEMNDLDIVEPAKEADSVVNSEAVESATKESVIEPAADVNPPKEKEETKMSKYTINDVFSEEEDEVFKALIANTKQRVMNRDVLDNMCDAADEYDAAPEEDKDFWKVVFYVRRYIAWHTHLGYKIDNYGVFTQSSDSKVINKAAAIILSHLNISVKDEEEREKVFKTAVENIENANKEGWTHTVKVMFSKGCGMVWDFAKGLFWYVINGVKHIAKSAFDCVAFVLVNALSIIDSATSKDFGVNSPGLLTKMVNKYEAFGRSATEAK